ncbi:CDGSH iron-sulfur domain-containing protein 1-like [Stegodyphus dumicola]|uniref:CDGSH iron-sulfur domain-containing protein 1-like n=1 Tax=Stegodyphus dumicola TaxID=202533 RepID=UPI0015AFD58A|nr:CDGSH iron-sulfur domain-containing protein 1-like [Stegodyphus dumicola]
MCNSPTKEPPRRLITTDISPYLIESHFIALFIFHIKIFTFFFSVNENVQHVLPWAVSAAALSYALYATIVLVKKKGRVNKKVQLGTDKVVHSVDIEDIGKKSVFCRCWKSEKFPYCDGSHNKHNEETGDNLGPLIVKQKDS